MFVTFLWLSCRLLEVLEVVLKVLEVVLKVFLEVKGFSLKVPKAKGGVYSFEHF